jgi:ribose transport system permease protein
MKAQLAVPPSSRTMANPERQPLQRLAAAFPTSAVPAVVMLLAVVACNAWLQPDFFSADSLGSLLQNAAPVLLVCMAQAVIVLVGELDLSVGAGVSLVNCLLAGLPAAAGLGTGATCALALAGALLAGLCNGFLVGYLRQSALVCTFATGAIWFGIALAVMPRPGGAVPEVLGTLYAMRLGPVPLAGVPLVFAALLWIAIQRHRLGRRLVATGSNADAALKSGIDIRVVKLLAYGIAWLLVFASAACISAETASGDARLGLSYTLNSVAAVVIGGMSLAGGRGSMVGAACGALVLVLIGNVVYFAGIPSNYQEVFKGAVIVLALGFSFVGSRRPA